MYEDHQVISIYRKAGKPDSVMEAYNNTLQLWKVQVESKYIATSFGDIHVLVAGPEDAEPMVLLHGFGFSSTVWLDNIEAVSTCYRVYAIDFPGDINKSISTRPIKSKEECAAWFAEVLDGLDIDRVHVCGHSFGGFIALVLAARLSSRIQKIIALAPGASLQPQSKAFFIRSLFAGLMPTTTRLTKLMDYMTGKGNSVNETIKNQFITGMQHALPRTRLFVSCLNDDELQLISNPVLLIIGDQDIQYNVNRAVERANKLIHNIEASIIPRTGHGLPLERPELVNGLILDFLGRKP
ncbi:alpha/beta fold hydrolase [Paenibacillus sp. FSL R7-0331]|uniref:alpha/beta fold hydrolase n=1 Tax=Paenibacillus sp. FSL R7-0331 TaxID=1536773 RepID=UPI0004F5DBCF|nr:alpha/beta hydrolase [Paenibacillus sp. FSL R7-0331]AIQ52521.1 carboxylesterase [Paenibacillus sp. FSL R7-0331]